MIHVDEIAKDQWERLRDLRIASLASDPQAFGANATDEDHLTQEIWRERLSKGDHIVGSISGLDVGIMSIEVLDGDFGATCWIGGCWINPQARGQGVFRAMFDYVDIHAASRNWTVQGLGVWQDNLDAIMVYEKLGFVALGEPKPSTRQPGKFYQRMIRHSPTN